MLTRLERLRKAVERADALAKEMDTLACEREEFNTAFGDSIGTVESIADVLKDALKRAEYDAEHHHDEPLEEDEQELAMEFSKSCEEAMPPKKRKAKS